MLGLYGGGGAIRYQPTSASAAAWRGFIDTELSERRARDKGARTERALFVASGAKSQGNLTLVKNTK